MEALLAECDICGRKFSQSSVWAHKKTHMPKPVEGVHDYKL